MWIVALPLAFVAVVTITASAFKIFSPVPAVGYWAQNAAFREALAAGETSFGNAKTVEAMEAVVRNTTVQGSLSILFVTLSIIVILAALIRTFKAVRGDLGQSTEDPATPSRLYAPAGFLPTKPERELQREWDAVPSDKLPKIVRH